MADDGGDFTVVSVFPVVVTLLVEVDSVTIGSAPNAEHVKTTKVVTTNLLNIYIP